MKRRSACALLAALALLTALMLTACGGGGASNGTAASAESAGGESWKSMTENFNPSGVTEMGSPADMADTAAPESPAAPAGEDAVNTSVQEGAVEYEEKIIYTASLELETTEYETASKDLEHLVAEVGGFFENSTAGNRGSGNRWAEYTVRVPSGKFQTFLDRAGELCHVTWQTSNRQNISEQYYDTAGRLKTQQIKLARLQALLEKAENMEDIITIESAISETEWMIDDYSGTLRHYDNQVDYSTITVNLQEVYRLSNVEETPVGFGGRFANAFTGGLRAFGEWLEDLVIFLAYSWLWLALLAAVAAGLVLLLRRRAGRNPEKPSRKKLRKGRSFTEEPPDKDKTGDDKPEDP